MKAGMTHLWDQWGQLVPCTVLHVDRNRVLQTKTLAGDGYDAVQVGAGGKKMKNEKKPEVGHVRSLLPRSEWSPKVRRNVGLRVLVLSLHPDSQRFYVFRFSHAC